jgi:prepilin-type N-terminal cleavage/methylation domain-containing protein
MKTFLGPNQCGSERDMPRLNMRGFSLLEMMIVVAIGLIMAGITFISLQPALKDGRVNNAYDSVMTQMRQARELAVNGRTRYIVAFGIKPPPGGVMPGGAAPLDQWSVQTWSLAVGVPINPPPVWIRTIELPNDIQFQTLAGLPAAAPDSFGSGKVALDFDQGVGAGSTSYVVFQPDGSSHDVNGNFNSGILYMARAGDLYSSRAVTVYGVTGRIRGWRLVQSPAAKWVMQ